MQQDSRRRLRKFFPLFALGGIAIFGLMTLSIQYLWNWLIAETFSLKPFSFWQAMGLFVLCRLLFGGFKFGDGSPRGGKPSFGGRNKWMNMSEEERQKFKSDWEKRCEKRD